MESAKTSKSVGLDEIALRKKHFCKICKEMYPSNNKLHSHLRDRHHKQPHPCINSDIALINSAVVATPDTQSSAKLLPEASEPSLTIVKSVAPKSTAPPGYAFRGRRYAQLLISVASLHNDQTAVCLDTG